MKCPYDQGIYKNLQSVLGKWPIFWFIPGGMSGTGLDFPINTRKYMNDDEEATINEKNTFTSSTSLNRRSNSTMDSSEWAITANEKEDVDITPLQPLKTKPSTNTIGSIMPPATPGSILTFASNATTLVDYKLPPQTPTKSSSSSYPADDTDYSMPTYR